jgi:hypothetical protein
MSCHLRTILLLTAVSLAGASLVKAAEKGIVSGAGGSITPPRTMVPHEAVEPTPGEKVAQRQRTVFVRDRFVEVFGEEAVDALEINWDVLGDISLPFDDATKRDNMRRIKNFMQREMRVRTDDDVFDLLFGRVMRIAGEIEGVHTNRLEDHARGYFSRLFPESEMTFRGKSGGDQLGSIVAITHPDGSSVKYYVKTHSEGVKTSNSTAAKKVNVIELFVYKVLEGFGVGCESHFFGRDERNFFIATRDASYHGPFKEYSKIKDDDPFRASIWGGLSRVLVDLLVTEDAQREVIESAIKEDPVAQNFLRQMILLDLLARLMLLSDLQTNSDNFGFIHREGELPRLRAIDFRLHNTDNFRITDRDFGGFLAGNGLFHYASSDRAVRYALRERHERERRALAKEIFARELLHWEDILERAKASTLKALTEAGLPEEELRLFIVDLNTHTDTLKANFALFDRLLHEGAGEAAL